MKKSRSSRQAASVSPYSATASVAAHPYNYVSRKFYNDLVDRIVEACGLLPNAGNLRLEAIMMINSYLHKKTIDLTACPTELALIFTILRPEIDRAMARSASARRRAASRRKMNHPENRRDDGAEELREGSAEAPRKGRAEERMKSGIISSHHRMATDKPRCVTTLPDSNRKAAMCHHSGWQPISSDLAPLAGRQPVSRDLAPLPDGNQKATIWHPLAGWQPISRDAASPLRMASEKLRSSDALVAFTFAEEIQS